LYDSYGAGKGANWHPSRAFHMLRGEAIAWIYSLILLETIEMVALDLQTKQPVQLLQGKLLLAFILRLCDIM